MARPGRDEFPARTIRRLAERTGFKCSFPDCNRTTIGPSQEANDATASIGEACHISAAAVGPGARRNDFSITSAKRKSIENGIWMCRTHAKLIDSDEITYTVEKLEKWKEVAEERARIKLETGDLREIYFSLHEVPNLPDFYLERPEWLDRLKLLVLDNQQSRVVLTAPKIGLYGMGGIGKTVLACVGP